MMDKDYTTPRSAVLLTAAAGAIDAYTFLTQGGVFAGLQTGNLILAGVHLGQGEWSLAAHYGFSILMFALGTWIARYSQAHAPSFPRHQTRILMAEVLMTGMTGLLGSFLNRDLVIVLLAITAAAQLQTFRVYEGGPFTPLMMTGNIRQLVDSLYGAPHDLAARRKATATLRIILGFASGALLTSLLVERLGSYTILLASLFLLLILFVAPAENPAKNHQ